MPNLQAALDHYRSMATELRRQEQVEAIARLPRVAELDRRIEREQMADAELRRA